MHRKTISICVSIKFNDDNTVCVGENHKKKIISRIEIKFRFCYNIAIIINRLVLPAILMATSNRENNTSTASTE